MSKVKAGFSLVEVVIALAIFGLGVTVLTQSFMGGVLSLEKFNILEQSDPTLEEVYAEVLKIESREQMESGGEFESLKNGLIRWKVDVEQLEEPVTIFRLMVKLEGQNGLGQDREYYVYRPKWIDLGQDNSRRLGL